MSPFDYLNSINDTKKDIMVDDVSEKAYVPFIINRGLSYFYDTVLFANEMNRNHHLSKRAQFSFFINSIRKKKRFSKWFKSTESEDLMIVKEYYGYNNAKAQSALAVLSEEQLKQLKQKLSKGGQHSSNQ
jgi:hypothetical protein